MNDINKIMNAVGQLAAHVYGREIPADVQAQLLTHPATGIAMMAKKPGLVKLADQEEIARIIDKIPAESEALRGVKLHNQGPFWKGYYDYLYAADKEFTAENLTAIGKVLYGERWQTDLADALNINSRRIREMVAGTRKIPPGIVVDILTLLKEKQIKIDSVIGNLIT
ncbi:hypothetical protein [Neisseria arctica]|uniref:hypothetical protein n=1 Tax=Neisseria arctica TaxID=1470200 RepID=UPI00069B242E|nr:hypothetical protein [Neisseria arctica]UOO87518.1 hypothetical protein LVJ86_04535 [Neisseria arctica]